MKTKSYWALAFAMAALYANAQNTNLGTNAGNAGSNNTSIGASAGDVVTGTGNSSNGFWAGKAITTGGYNVAVGAYSLVTLTTGSSNTAVGDNSGYFLTTASGNSFFGSSSGSGANHGNNNTFIGTGSGSYSGKGVGNTFLGYRSGYGYLASSGDVEDYNTIIGYNAGYKLKGSRNVFIGYESGYNEIGSDKLYIDNSSTTTPLIYGDFSTNKVGINSLPNTTHALTVGGTIHSTGLYVNGVLVSGDLSLWNRTGNNVYTQSTTDNIGIGTTLTNNPFNYKLAVKGKIGAQEVQIENTSLAWSDFVFYKNYQLRSLEEVEVFIQQNGHLPEIPSEKQVREEGIKLAEMDAKLLQKIEELTLYVIQLKKEIEVLKAGKQ